MFWSWSYQDKLLKLQTKSEKNAKYSLFILLSKLKFTSYIYVGFLFYMLSSTFPNNVFRCIRTTALVSRSQALIPLGHRCKQQFYSSYRVIYHIYTNSSVVKSLHIYLQVQVYTCNKHNSLSPSLSTKMRKKRNISKKYARQNKLLNFLDYVCMSFLFFNQVCSANNL